MIVSTADRGLADGAVADDQFALAAAEREQRVDDEHAGLHRLGDQIAVDDRRRRRSIGSCPLRRRSAPPSSGRPSGSTTGRAGRPTGMRTTRPCRAPYRPPRRLGIVKQHAADQIPFECLTKPNWPPGSGQVHRAARQVGLPHARSRRQWREHARIAQGSVQTRQCAPCLSRRAASFRYCREWLSSKSGSQAQIFDDSVEILVKAVVQ